MKAEWGLKRTCNSCGARFYDMRREPIICPKCDATVNPSAFSRTQRSKATAVAAAPIPVEEPVPAAAAATDDSAVADDELKVGADIDDAETAEKADEESDDAVIEDASELGEDKDDMFEVMDKVVGDEEETR